LAFIMLIIPTIILSSVTIAHFEVDPGEEAIFVYWETASEVGNLGFYVWRSEEEHTGYYKLPISEPSLQFIPSADEGAGAFYDFVDEEVISGILYYYKVQDVPDTGSDGEYTLPLSAGIGLVTPTQTPTNTPTPTPTSTSQETPTNTPTPEPAQPYVRFWTEMEDMSAGECTTIQWQTEYVKSVFLDGEGVPGLGAKTFCPCDDEEHTLMVYLQDQTRQDYTIELTVTGECGEPTVIPTSTPTPTNIVTSPETSATATSTPRPIAIRTDDTTISVTNTLIPTKEPGTTPTTSGGSDTEVRPTPTVPSPDENTYIPTPTRSIVQGHTPRQTISQRTAILAVVALGGCVIFALGVWLWRSR
jgi:hypothetical protein